MGSHGHKFPGYVSPENRRALVDYNFTHERADRSPIETYRPMRRPLSRGGLAKSRRGNKPRAVRQAKKSGRPRAINRAHPSKEIDAI
jgi:hypothetical protein